MMNTQTSLDSNSVRVAKKSNKQGATQASTFWTLLFFALVALFLFDGWQNRIYDDINAESGIGYALGIVGGLMMILLLLYPLRKRWKAMRSLGAVKHWFRLHMMLGVLGPVSILYHANFGLGSLNSNVALFCMLVVASSGLLGRYFYAKIHHGLYGQQTSLQELREFSSQQHNLLTENCSYIPQLAEHLAEYEKTVLAPPRSLLISAWLLLALAVKSHLDFSKLLRQCKQAIMQQTLDTSTQQAEIKKVRRYLAQYFATVRRAAEFSFYTRLFSLWHVLHLPLFVMMLITGIVHVVYVHMY